MENETTKQSSNSRNFINITLEPSPFGRRDLSETIYDVVLVVLGWVAFLVGVFCLLALVFVIIFFVAIIVAACTFGNLCLDAMSTFGDELSRLSKREKDLRAKAKDNVSE